MSPTGQMGKWQTCMRFKVWAQSYGTCTYFCYILSTWAMKTITSFHTLSQNTLNKQVKQINTSTDKVKYRTNTVRWKRSAPCRVRSSVPFGCPHAPPCKIRASIFYIRPDSEFTARCDVLFWFFSWAGALALSSKSHFWFAATDWQTCMCCTEALPSIVQSSINRLRCPHHLQQDQNCFKWILFWPKTVHLLNDVQMCPT